MTEDYKANIICPILREIVPILAPRCTLLLNELTTQRHRDDVLSFYTPQPPEQLEISVRVKEMLGITGKCIELGLRKEAEQLLTAALPDFKAIPEEAWTMWRSVFMLVGYLLSLLFEQDDAQLNRIGSHFVTESIQLAAKNLAHSKPLKPQNWSQIHVRQGECYCSPCQRLTQFLLDGHQSVGRFPYAQKTRNHL